MRFWRRKNDPLYTWDEVDAAIVRFDNAAFAAGRALGREEGPEGKNASASDSPQRKTARSEWRNAEHALRTVVDELRLGRKR